MLKFDQTTFILHGLSIPHVLGPETKLIEHIVEVVNEKFWIFICEHIKFIFLFSFYSHLKFGNNTSLVRGKS